MQPLTEKQTQRVWSRVMSAQTAPAAAMENPAPAAQAQSETLTPEKLLSLIDGERADSALYAYLAARMKGRAQAMLRAIAQQEACHAKKLAAVYFLNTGKKACPGRPERPCVTCINETLRQQYTAEHAAHEAYAALAFEIAGVHHAVNDRLIFAVHAALLEHLIDQRGLAMVDVRDDCNVTNFVLRHNGAPSF